MLIEMIRLVVSPNWLSARILLFVIAAAPFPFGSTNKPAIAFWCFVLGIATLCLSWRSLQKRQIKFIAGILVVFLGYAFVLHEQLSDHPWVAQFHPIWRDTEDALGRPLSPSVSIVKNQAFFALGAPLANMMSMLLGLVVGASRPQARQIMKVIAWSGAGYAVYGIASFLLEPGMLLWRARQAYFGSVTGTFINRNTAATYFGSCCVLWLLLLLSRLHGDTDQRFRSWRRFFRPFANVTVAGQLPAFGGLLVCLTAMFLAQSRAGVTLSLLAMILASTILLRRQLPPRTGVLISLGSGTLAALALMLLLGGRVSDRFETQGLVDAGRIEAWRSTLHMIADYPWFGTGIGTFPWSFPPYRSADISMWGVWDAAHSTPLELASEVGLPLAFLVAMGWIVMFFVLIRGVFSRSRPSLTSLAALIVAGLAILHSSIDFTLQAPGYTIPFFALFGAGIAQCLAVPNRNILQI